MLVILAAIATLTACATSLPQIIERDGDTFDVRYDPGVQTQAEVDAKANSQCANGAAGYVSQQIGFDGLAYRTYRCAFRSAAPETVSVAVGSDSETIARRECGGEVRPETVHHETNVVIYRCLREAN